MIPLNIYFIPIIILQKAAEVKPFRKWLAPPLIRGRNCGKMDKNFVLRVSLWAELLPLPQGVRCLPPSES